jgi:hypothetical protein
MRLENAAGRQHAFARRRHGENGPWAYLAARSSVEFIALRADASSSGAFLSLVDCSVSGSSLHGSSRAVSPLEHWDVSLRLRPPEETHTDLTLHRQQTMKPLSRPAKFFEEVIH